MCSDPDSFDWKRRIRLNTSALPSPVGVCQPKRKKGMWSVATDKAEHRQVGGPKWCSYSIIPLSMLPAVFEVDLAADCTGNDPSFTLSKQLG